MKIRLIVPNRSNERDWANVRFAADPVHTYGPRIAAIAGGFTATQGTGGWTDDNGSLIVEPVTVFDIAIPQTFTFADIHNNISGVQSAFRNLAKTIAQDLHQECVYLEIDGQVEFVKP
jgi:hypothetical protein